MALNNGLVRYDSQSVEPYPGALLDLKQIPLSALRQKSRSILSRTLNNPKILLTEEGLHRDWRGVMHYANFSSEDEALICVLPDPMAMVIKIWTRNESGQIVTFEQLLSVLGIIDRWDVADDIRENLEDDAKFYLTNKHKRALQNISASNNLSNLPVTSDADLLTDDDIINANKGLPPQSYDGFVLFDDKDIEFATELIGKMEDCGFKLFVKERDLRISGSIEHESILRLISERCRRLIVIVSSAFLESDANKFFVNYAQALGIDRRQKKIVPVLIQNCVLPPTLNYCFLLNYQRSARYWNFWEKLKQAIQCTPLEIQESNKSIPSITITEVDSPSSALQECTSGIVELTDSKDSMTPTKTPRKRRDNIHSSASENCITTLVNCKPTQSRIDTPPNSCNKISEGPKLIPPPPRMRCSRSMVNLDDTPSNSNLSCSSSTLNGSSNSVQSTKKMKWYKKFLSPTTNSSSVPGSELTKEKTKKKWFRRKIASYS